MWPVFRCNCNATFESVILLQVFLGLNLMIEHLDFKRIIHLTIMEFSEGGRNCDYIYILNFIFYVFMAFDL